ncbi:MAG: hypothetical protein SNJ59_09225 [Aggregatilineales bacterium]
MNLLIRLTPFAEISPQHPLLMLERKLCERGRPSQRFRKRMRVQFAAGVLLGMVLWLGVMIAANGFSGSLSDFERAIPAGGSLNMLFAACGSLLLDIAAVNAGLHGHVRALLEGRQDLLRLTGQPQAAFVRAHHAAAQMRVWPAVLLLVGFRAGALICTGLAVVAWLVAAGPFMDELWSLVFISAALVSGGLLAALALLEPFWRVRATTAVGMWVSAMSVDGISVSLLAIAALFAFWITQGLVIIALLLVSTFLFMPLVFLAIILWPLLGFSFSTLGIWGYFVVAQAWALRRVMCRLHRFLLNAR